MAEPLKNMYNPRFFENLCPVLAEHIPGFHAREFVHLVFNHEWPDMALKERVRHIAGSLHHFMPHDFLRAVRTLVSISDALERRGSRAQGFEHTFIPDYIEVYGACHPDESMLALREVTRFVSAEFAIRPLLLRDPEKIVHTLLVWAGDDHPNIRRCASEACRPRLPWAMAIPQLKKDPTPILPILEALKADPSDYVRRSVANNLNDIAKDHPQLVLELAQRWRGSHPDTDSIIRHACRSLFRKGSARAFALHGLDPESRAAVRQLALPDRVKIGKSLDFSFVFVNQEKRDVPFRLEYAIDYLTQSGKTSRKVFTISERVFPAGKRVEITRRRSFRDLSTRTHRKGRHRLSILANGIKLTTAEFLVC